jgi:argininosuccinate lyase
MSMAEVYRYMAKNPGVPFREACRVCGRAGARRRKDARNRRKGTMGRKARARKREEEELERQRRYVEGLEKRGLF